MPAAASKLRLAIVGAGDVAYRHYLPALQDLGEEVAITAFVDPRPGAAERAAAQFIACVPDGIEPVLTAEHARHVLEATLAARASIED